MHYAKQAMRLLGTIIILGCFIMMFHFEVIAEAPTNKEKETSITSIAVENITEARSTNLEEPTTQKNKNIKKEKSEKKVKKAKKAKKAKKVKKTKKKITKKKWTGQVLTRSLGTVIGPSGKETYYNLPMQGVITYMKELGYTEKYWVRDDGVKMYGKYIMCAANLKLRPKGTVLETSLGTAMVCDTGSFAETNPQQLDIAVAW